MAITAPDGTIIFDTTVAFDEDHTDSTKPKLVIRHDQYIPDEFVSQLKRDKIDTLHEPTGDFYKVATIPVGWVNKWKRKGFDINTASAREILSRLRKEQVDAFITTNKRI
jgi:hypothetical protein